MIIGSSGLDHDLSEMLTTSVKRGRPVSAQFVSGSEAASRKSRDNFQNRTRFFNAVTAPLDGVEFNGGLLNYIDSGAALRFAQT